MSSIMALIVNGQRHIALPWVWCDAIPPVLSSHSLTCRKQRGGESLPPASTLQALAMSHSGMSSTCSGFGLDGQSQSGLLSSMSSVSNWLGYTSSTMEEAILPRDTVATFQGNWLSHLEFSDHPMNGTEAERVWVLDETMAHAFESVAQEQRLPSDCTFREDLQLLARGDVKGAEVAKYRIEERQRRDRKLREMKK